MHLLPPLVLQGLLHTILFKGVNIDGVQYFKTDSLSLSLKTSDHYLIGVSRKKCRFIELD